MELLRRAPLGAGMFLRVILLACASSAAHGQTASGNLTVTKFVTGWRSDAFRLAVAQTVVNPAGCPRSDGYMSEPSNPGHKIYLSAVLYAMATGKTISVYVSDLQGDCVGGGPKIIGVNVE
jgi:hypothetical protein